MSFFGWHKYNKSTYVKPIFQDTFTIIDAWGADHRSTYKIDISILRTFSWSNGFEWLIKVPDGSFKASSLWVVIGETLRFLYRGGCPCYYRLMDQLLEKGLWDKL